MFSGIVEQVGRLSAIATEGTARRMTVAADLAGLALGESVAVNGVCLTVVASGPGHADFFVSPETLTRSNLGAMTPGGFVNLERSMTLATRLSGHLVQGHVDGKARLIAVRQDGEARLVEFNVPAALSGFCVEKGSIALNGISLTLNNVGEPGADGWFSVGLTLIPHTWNQTNLRHCGLGDEINVEVDVLAKYVERQCQAYLKRSTA
jgi:riboflavin synthase